MPYTLAFADRYRRVLESVIESDTSDSVAFASIPDNEETLIRYMWTGKQFTKLLSSVMTGADLMFPDQADEIIWQLIKGLHVPPTVDDDDTCKEYLPSAPFIHYYPDNPYIPNDKAFGWNFEAWHRWFQFDTFFPDFVDDWLNGNLNGLTGYQDTDVLFNISSIIAPNILNFLNSGGFLPKIEIKFSGTGQLNVTLLSFPLGGKAVIELDQEPNILDILTGGVLDPAAFMVELNRDIVNFPPDEYPIITIPIEVTTAGAHTLYINFIPVIDDSGTPLQLGGGLRSVEFCGFAEAGNVGIEQIYWDGCELKQLQNGVISTIVTAEQIQACLDIPTGGTTEGGLIINGATYNKTISSTNFTTTGYAAVSGTGQAHGFQKVNALIGVSATIANSGNNNTYIKPVIVNGGVRKTGQNLTEARGLGTSNRELWAWDYFTGINLTGTNEIFIDGKVSAGTGTLGGGYDLEYVVIEVDDFSLLFVEDIRIDGGQLQKKIAGIWIDVSESFEAIIANLQSQVSSALTQAASAVTTANNAVAVATGAVTVNNLQNIRLTTIESDIEDLEIDASAQAITLADHESRIDALEAASGGTAIWQTYFKDLRLSAGDWVATGGSWISGQGMVASFDGSPITISQTIPYVSQRISYLQVDYRILDGNSDEMMIEFLGQSLDSQPIVVSGNADLTLARVYVRIPIITQPSNDVAIRFSPLSNDGRIRIETLKFIGLSFGMFADGD